MKRCKKNSIVALVWNCRFIRFRNDERSWRRTFVVCVFYRWSYERWCIWNVRWIVVVSYLRFVFYRMLLAFVVVCCSCCCDCCSCYVNIEHMICNLFVWFVHIIYLIIRTLYWCSYAKLPRFLHLRYLHIKRIICSYVPMRRCMKIILFSFNSRIDTCKVMKRRFVTLSCLVLVWFLHKLLDKMVKSCFIRTRILKYWV